MRVQKNNGSRMFLTELLFSILFFIIVVSVCVELFARAYDTSARSRELAEAVGAASNCAEYFMVWDFSPTSWNETFEGSMVNDEGFVNYMDENFDSCMEADALYVVSGSFTEERNVIRAEIKVKSVADEEEIYKLEVSRALK